MTKLAPPLTVQEVHLNEPDLRCLKKIRDDPSAAVPLRLLAEKAGRRDERWNKELIEILFIGFAQALAEQLKKSMPRPRDSSPKAVVRLAASTCRVAQKIRSLNGERFWDAETPASIFEGMFTERRGDDADFKSLPRILDAYARSIRIKATRELRYRKASKEIQRQTGTPAKVQHRLENELLERIRSLTGSMHREQVFSILCVLYAQLGLKKAVEGASHHKRTQRAHRKT